MKRESVLEKIQAVMNGGDESEFLDWLMSENGNDINSAKGSYQRVTTENKGLLKQIEELKAEVEKANSKSMTDEERLEKALNEYKEKSRELEIKRNRIDASGELAKAGLTQEEAESLLGILVSDDSEATGNAVAALVGVIASQRESVAASTKQELLSNTPKPSPNAGNPQSDFQRAFDEASSRMDGVAMAAAIRNGFMQK